MSWYGTSFNRTSKSRIPAREAMEGESWRFPQGGTWGIEATEPVTWTGQGLSAAAAAEAGAGRTRLRSESPVVMRLQRQLDRGRVAVPSPGARSLRRGIFAGRW